MELTSSDGEGRREEVATAVGCPSETVRDSFKTVLCRIHYILFAAIDTCLLSLIVEVSGHANAIPCHTQAAAGKADICMGCPGRQQCLSQSKSPLPQLHLLTI